MNEGLFSESVMRKFLVKYSNEEGISFYNHYVQKSLANRMEFPVKFQQGFPYQLL